MHSEPSPVRRFAVSSLIMLAGAASADARADWPYSRLVSASLINDVYPVSASIRNWGPTDKVYISWDKHEDGVGGGLSTEDQLYFVDFTCGNNNGCSTVTQGAVALPGEPVWFNNLLHNSMAVHRASSQDPIEVALMANQHPGDCDLDGDDIYDLPAVSGPEQDGLDQWVFRYDSTNGMDTTGDPADVGSAGVCENHGYSRARFFGGDLTSCFTFDTDPTHQGVSQTVSCNDDIGSSPNTPWVDHVDASNLDPYLVARNEDHPGFDFVGSSGAVAAAGHLTNGSGHAIRVHFPTSSGDTVVQLQSSGSQLQQPDLISANGKLHVVWSKGSGAGATIEYASCTPSGTVDCTDVADWTIDPTPPASGFNSASFPQLAIDGKDQFLAFQYDDDSTAGVKSRVRVAHRCEGGSWTVDTIRTLSGADVVRDQSIAFGRPSIVLNGSENIAHLVFVEFNDDYNNAFDIGSPTSSNLYWYHTSYTPCP